ncbi:hypothetical protein AC249_AIPGENE5333 [Exaiptasia diaphana]|nr:hypothetical protein AC249_AIPGENE5333 [Exaiptasia diaphana]
MRNGCVEPRNGGSKKIALDQGKVNLIKKCIKIKYGQKIFEKMWTEIRISLNQKCLDKLKQYRRSLSDQQNPDDVE